MNVSPDRPTSLVLYSSIINNTLTTNSLFNMSIKKDKDKNSSFLGYYCRLLKPLAISLNIIVRSFIFFPPQGLEIHPKHINRL